MGKKKSEQEKYEKLVKKMEKLKKKMEKKQKKEASTSRTGDDGAAHRSPPAPASASDEKTSLTEPTVPSEETTQISLLDQDTEGGVELIGDDRTEWFNLVGEKLKISRTSRFHEVVTDRRRRLARVREPTRAANLQ